MASLARLWIAAVLTLGACSTATATPPVVAPSRNFDKTVAAKPPPISYPAHGHEAWLIAPAQSDPPAGHDGRLFRYRVAVEKDIKGLAPADFARTVETTLANPQGWTAGGRFRFQRVGPGRPYDFIVYLATPGTRDRLCDDNGDGYTSCRNGKSVVLNVARWVKGVPGFAAAGLPVYRQYMVNHEVGHRLGNGHELCPGPGDLAPVMQQQTLGLHGCRPNPWPYPDGHAYHGRSGVYDDHAPAGR
ncbi:DUF3152 domain-containing protein [Actinoplanes sp. CA-142083]|uniref:DUF3152 domain-containing protein n=1 Tax=Actinoplanes sp. CA-142083 TaxID=3239903 RepID=UPI003D923F12